MGALLIRPLRAADRAAVAEMLAACGAFHDEEIRIALEMVDAGIAHGDYTLLALEIGGAVRGYACAGQTPLTASTWDLYWMCVHPAQQRAGAGRALLAAVEAHVARAGGERIRVETSGRADYARARAFYGAAGYRTVGVIADFYRPGDDCMVLCKALPSPRAAP